MKLIIDADACPVMHIATDIAKNFNLAVILVCDYTHFIDIEGTQTITVSKGNDSADFKIISLLNKGDIVITQDTGLAALVLAKKAYAIHHSGREFDDSNIDGYLNIRHINKVQRKMGYRTKGPKKRKDSNNESFAAIFKEFIKTKL